MISVILNMYVLGYINTYKQSIYNNKIKSSHAKSHSLYSALFRYVFSLILYCYFAKKNGRFVVLGAGDGEFRDYTLELERDNGWTGMLVEPNPHLFKLLKTKNRNAELVSSCISPYSYPAKVRLW